jgi:hypothetical protein
MKIPAGGYIRRLRAMQAQLGREFMREKLYGKFKGVSITSTSRKPNGDGDEVADKFVAVVTDDEDGFIIAKIPTHIKNPESVANAIAEALNKSGLALTDLI